MTNYESTIVHLRPDPNPLSGSGINEINKLPLFFTNHVESMAGVWYHYCEPDEFCGRDSCMGLIHPDIHGKEHVDKYLFYKDRIPSASKCVISTEANLASPSNTAYNSQDTGGAYASQGETNSGIGETTSATTQYHPALATS